MGAGRRRKGRGRSQRTLEVQGRVKKLYLVKFPISCPIVPFSDTLVHLLSKGPEEVFSNPLDVEALITLEGIKPLTPDATLVQQERSLPICLLLPWVELECDEEGC